MHSRDKRKGPAIRTEVSERDAATRDDDDRPLDVTVEGDPAGARRIVVSIPARFVRTEERSVQAVVADAADEGATTPRPGE